MKQGEKDFTAQERKEIKKAKHKEFPELAKKMNTSTNCVRKMHAWLHTTTEEVKAAAKPTGESVGMLLFTVHLPVEDAIVTECEEVFRHNDNGRRIILSNKETIRY